MGEKVVRLAIREKQGSKREKQRERKDSIFDRGIVIYEM